MKDNRSRSTPPRINKFVTITSIAVLFAIGFFVLFFHDGYPQRIISRFSSKSDIPFVATHSDKAVDAWKNCLAQLHTKADIVFFGDSITRRGDFASSFQDKTVCNLGLGSDTITGMTDRVSMINVVFPETLFVMGGINSLRDSTLDHSVNEFGELLAKIKSECNADVFILSVLPISKEKASSIGCSISTIKSFNSAIETLTAEYGFTYIDLFSNLADSDGHILPEFTTDGVHLTENGYVVFVDAVSPYIN